MTDKVFVYGTLKSTGDRSIGNWSDGQLLGKAKTTHANFSLNDLGPYPAVSLGGKSHIVGEVWRVDRETMERLDLIEGYPHYYLRQIIETTLGDAWMYYMLRQDMSTQSTQLKGKELEWN